MTTHLPTGVFGSWEVTSLLDSLNEELSKDQESTVLKLYFYAITSAGWREVRQNVMKWLGEEESRSAIAFVGTDHGLTRPEALLEMQQDGVIVHIMTKYQGIFHPKVVWLKGDRKTVVWVGSNNLTRDGLLNNIEFAVVVRSKKAPLELEGWTKAVEAGSDLLTPALLKSYKDQRQRFEKERSKSNTQIFTWTRKQEPPDITPIRPIAGELIVEVMPRETGSDGTQLQIPMDATARFFGVKRTTATKTINLQSNIDMEVHRLKITVFRNRTARISLNDLEYGDRPCVIVFRKLIGGNISYEIVAQSIFPTRYKLLLKECKNRTRIGSRRWTIVEED